jgi:hypothetical protein
VCDQSIGPELPTPSTPSFCIPPFFFFKKKEKNFPNWKEAIPKRMVIRNIAWFSRRLELENYITQIGSFFLE